MTSAPLTSCFTTEQTNLSVQMCLTILTVKATRLETALCARRLIVIRLVPSFNIRITSTGLHALSAFHRLHLRDCLWLKASGLLALVLPLQLQRRGRLSEVLLSHGITALMTQRQGSRRAAVCSTT